MTYLSTNKDHQIILEFYVQPRSSRTTIVGLHDDSIKMAITAPPVDGKANTQVTTFLAKLFKIPKSSVTILSGHQSRHKKVAITGIKQAEIKTILAPLL